MAVSKKKNLVYIGPTIPGVAYNGTTYIDGLPEALEDKFKEIPALRQLLVPPSGWPDAQEQLKAQNGRLYIAYKMVQEYIRKGEK